MKKNSIKCGLFSPINCEEFHFDYEVLEDSGVVKNYEYEDEGRICTYPEKTIVIKSLGGNILPDNRFVVNVQLADAMKPLREGEIISATLSFSIVKDEDGKYHQRVDAKDIYTLDDYYQMCEENAPAEVVSMLKTE